MAEVFVGGELLDLRLERWPVIDPATGEEVDAAVHVAFDAFPAWRDTTAAKRGQLVVDDLGRVAFRRLEAVRVRQGTRHRGARLLYGDQIRCGPAFELRRTR